MVETTIGKSDKRLSVPAVYARCGDGRIEISVLAGKPILLFKERLDI